MLADPMPAQFGDVHISVRIYSVGCYHNEGYKHCGNTSME